MDGVKSELLVSDNHTAGKGKLCGMLGIRVQGCCWFGNEDETLKHKDSG